MSAELIERVPLEYYLAGPPRNGYSPVESADWTGVQMLGLGCLTPDGFEPRQLKNAPGGITISHSAILRDGDLLMSRANTRELVGLVGRYRDVGSPCIYPDLIMRLEVSENCSPEFLEILLRSLGVRQSLASRAQGTSESMVKISAESVRSLRVPLLSVTEQWRVVEAVYSIAESERDLEAVIAKLRSVRRGVLLKGMSAVEASVAPVGWERVPLREVVPSADYGISVALNADPSGVPTLRMNNLRAGRPDLKELRYSPQEVNPRVLLQTGDVLFNRTNSIEHVGRAGIWGGELERATFASYLVRLNPDIRRIIPRYLVEWLQHPVIRQRVRSIATVAVQQVNVNPSRLRELEIDLPIDLSQQEKLVSSLDACDQRIAAELENLDKLRTMKQGLVAELLRGNLAR
ncbi:restriction endonuclease subunit S [Streptomyces sp. NPDC001617]